jgi:ferredoxin
MKVIVDPDVCVGTGSCQSICPEVFEVGARGVAEVKLDAIPAELEESCREAAKACPVEAIKIEE